MVIQFSQNDATVLRKLWQYDDGTGGFVSGGDLKRAETVMAVIVVLFYLLN